MKTITRSRLPLRKPAREAAPGATGSSIEEVIGLASNPGEHVIEFAEALNQATETTFQAAGVAVTDSRILIVGEVAGSFEVTFAEDRSACWVISSKSMPDASTLLILGTDAGYQCLYFTAAWKPEAETIITRLAEGVENLEVPAQSPEAEPRDERDDVDRFELSLEFAGLFEAAGETDDEEE